MIFRLKPYFSKCGLRSLKVPETFSGDFEVTTIFLIRCYSFFAVLTSALMVQRKWQVTLQVLCFESALVVSCASELGTQRWALSLDSVLDGMTKLWVLLNLDVWGARLVNILTRWKVHTQHFSANCSTVFVLFRKSLGDWVGSWTALFCGTSFLLERTTCRQTS